MPPKKKTSDDGAMPKIDYSYFLDMETGNDWADSKKPAEIPNWIDSGSFAMNGVIAGDMTRGWPSNRIVMLAGETGTGKSFFARGAFGRAMVEAGHFLVIVDTENEYTDEIIQNFGIPKGTYRLIKEDSVEQVKFQLNTFINALEKRRKLKTEANAKLAFILDSQGFLDTEAAQKKVDEKKNKMDMSLQKEIKSLYKNIMNRMGQLEIPMVIINHTYVDNLSSNIPITKVTGGQGGQLASSIIVTLDKRGFKEGDVKTGILVNAKLFKSRLTRDGLIAKIYLSFKTGMSKWYGVHDFAKAADLIEKYNKTTFPKKGWLIPEKYSDWEGDYYLIKDPKIPKEEWLVLPENKLHSVKAIGTIFDEINEWVKEEFKLGKPINFEYDPLVDEDEDESDIEIAEQGIAAEWDALITKSDSSNESSDSEDDGIDKETGEIIDEEKYEASAKKSSRGRPKKSV